MSSPRKSPNDYVDEIRLLRHQRDGVLGRQVRVPCQVLELDPEVAGPEIVCTVICWVPEDHYVVALPSTLVVESSAGGTHPCLAGFGGIATVHAGVCVPR